jgi:hypothetical protein
MGERKYHFAAVGERCIAADFAFEVILGFAVLPLTKETRDIPVTSKYYAV